MVVLVLGGVWGAVCRAVGIKKHPPGSGGAVGVPETLARAAGVKAGGRRRSQKRIERNPGKRGANSILVNAQADEQS